MVTLPKSETAALQNLTVHPYSDLLIHHMGKGLADDITQGLATGDMFRSTPLWGVGQRTFFLHDGRTNDLLKAIQAHHSLGGDCDDSSHTPCYGPSEANGVINRFNALSKEEASDSGLPALALKSNRHPRRPSHSTQRPRLSPASVAASIVSA